MTAGEKLRWVVAGGGTGGHVTPALARRDFAFSRTSMLAIAPAMSPRLLLSAENITLSPPNSSVS